MKNILLVILSVIIALGIQNFVLDKNSPLTKTESAYDRVIRTNTLRCAYGIYPPWLAKDPNTGKLSGIMPDVLQAFEKVSGIKVVWEPESDWGTIAAVLQSGKADAWCSGMYITPSRGRVVGSSTPVFFSVADAYARPEDKKFDNNIDRINQPDVRIAVNSGDLSEEVSKRLFPKAQFIYKGPTGGESELFLNVATRKADVTISGPDNISTFNQTNPTNVLRKIEFQHPLMTFDAVISTEIHERELLELIDASLHTLINTGTIEQILRANLGSEYGTAYTAPKPRAN